MLESVRQLLRRARNRRFGILVSVVVALAGVSAIVVLAWPGGKSAGSGSPAAVGSSAAASARPAAPHAAASAQSMGSAQSAAPAQAAADEANLGGAVKPANSLRVAVWYAGPGGAALRAVSAQLGTVLMMHAEKQVPQMRQGCHALGAAATAALAAPSIPDSTMQLWYKRALADIGAGAANCRAAISSKLYGDEDLVVHQNATVMNQAMSEFSTGVRELYKATAYVKTLKGA